MRHNSTSDELCCCQFDVIQLQKCNMLNSGHLWSGGGAQHNYIKSPDSVAGWRRRTDDNNDNNNYNNNPSQRLEWSKLRGTRSIYIYIFISLHICIYIYTDIHIYLCISIHVYLFYLDLCMKILMDCASTYLCIYIYIYTHTYMIYTYIYICTCIYI